VWAVLERSPRGEEDSDKAQRELRPLRWGPVPSWAKDVKMGARVINARVETVHEKLAYRRAFARRRCLLPADGFYERELIKDPATGKARKQPYFIRPQDEQVMAEGLTPTAADTVGPDGADSGRNSHARAGTPTEEGPAPTAAGPSIRHQLARPLRTRRPLLVTGAAVLTALLGTTLAVSLDAAENSADRSALGSVESTPLQRPSSMTSAESSQKATGQPAASTVAPPSEAPRPSTSAASNPQARTLSSHPTTGSGPGTSADGKEALSGQPRPGAAPANDKNPSRKSTKSKGRPAGKKHR
jgi:SOS response associated peptidase (SRAP)